MGSFDRVWVKCPVCGADVGFQSKAGQCRMSDYRTHAVPLEIAGDLHGESETCENGHVVQLLVPGTAMDDEPKTAMMAIHEN